jgi:hypothetical protein
MDDKISKWNGKNIPQTVHWHWGSLAIAASGQETGWFFILM